MAYTAYTEPAMCVRQSWGRLRIVNCQKGQLLTPKAGPSQGRIHQSWGRLRALLKKGPATYTTWMAIRIHQRWGPAAYTKPAVYNAYVKGDAGCIHCWKGQFLTLSQWE